MHLFAQYEANDCGNFKDLEMLTKKFYSLQKRYFAEISGVQKMCC